MEKFIVILAFIYLIMKELNKLVKQIIDYLKLKKCLK